MQSENDINQILKDQEILFDRQQKENYFKKNNKKYLLKGKQKIEQMLKARSKKVQENRQNKQNKESKRKPKLNILKEVIKKSKQAAKLRPLLRLNKKLQQQLQNVKKPKLKALKNNQLQLMRIQQQIDKQNNDFKLKKTKLLLDSYRKIDELLTKVDLKEQKKKEKVQKEQQQDFDKGAQQIIQGNVEEGLKPQRNLDLGDIAISALKNVSPAFYLGTLGLKFLWNNKELIYQQGQNIKDYFKGITATKENPIIAIENGQEKVFDSKQKAIAYLKQIENRPEIQLMELKQQNDQNSQKLIDRIQELEQILKTERGEFSLERQMLQEQLQQQKEEADIKKSEIEFTQQNARERANRFSEVIEEKEKKIRELSKSPLKKQQQQQQLETPAQEQKQESPPEEQKMITQKQQSFGNEQEQQEEKEQQEGNNEIDMQINDLYKQLQEGKKNLQIQNQKNKETNDEFEKIFQLFDKLEILLQNNQTMYYEWKQIQKKNGTFSDKRSKQEKIRQDELINQSEDDRGQVNNLINEIQRTPQKLGFYRQPIWVERDVDGFISVSKKEIQELKERLEVFYGEKIAEKQKEGINSLKDSVGDLQKKIRSLQNSKQQMQLQKQPQQKQEKLQQIDEFLERSDQPQQQQLQQFGQEQQQINEEENEDVEEQESEGQGQRDPLNQKAFLKNMDQEDSEDSQKDQEEEFEGLTKQEFSQYFYESIAPEIVKSFQYSIIEQNQKIPKLQAGNEFNIVVFFMPADKEQIGRHFSVFIHDFERKQIYYFDPLGIVQNDQFQQAQQKIQEYISKLPYQIKLKVNSVNAQESYLSKGQQQNDQNYCAIYSLIFINRICVDLDDFKTATNFISLDEEEKEQQKDILKKGTGNEYFMFQ